MTAMRRGFTLIELLVVISIVAILAAMLMPIIALVRAQARQSVCANQQKQLAFAVMTYATSNDDILPSGIPFNDVGGPTSVTDYKAYYWAKVAGDLLEMPWLYQDPTQQAKIFRCPEQRSFFNPGFKTSYVMTFFASHPDHLHGTAQYKWVTLTRFAHSKGGLLGESLTDYWTEGAEPWWAMLAVKRLDGPAAGKTTPDFAAHQRHRGAFNATYSDGHTESVRPADYLTSFYLPVR